MRQVLVKEGYEVEEAVDGLKALERVAAWQPDLLVCDLNMPNLDGFGVIRGVRENLGRGDLEMAASLLEKDNPAHAALRQRVEAAQEVARQRRRRLRLLTGSVIAAGLAVFATVSAGLYLVNEEKEVARTAEQGAREAEQRAVVAKEETREALVQAQDEQSRTVQERNKSVLAEAKAMEAYTKAEQALTLVELARVPACPLGAFPEIHLQVVQHVSVG